SADFDHCKKGERVRNLKRRRVHMNVQLLAFATFLALSTSSSITAGTTARESKRINGATCASELEILKTLVSTVAVRFGAGATVKAGEAIKVTWTRGEHPFPLTTPVHIVLAMPEWARFKGPYILPIPPGGRVPSDIGYGAGQLRVFIPLAQSSIP